MSKGLEATKRLRAFNKVECDNDASVNCDLDIIEKDLEILEIIKKKLVNVLAFVHFDSLECYNLACVKGRELTETEFNLIKEWIDNE